MERYKGFRIFWEIGTNAYAVLNEKGRVIGYASTIDAAKRCIDDYLAKK